eukprot:5550947-Pyramimonas_sp.AAC.1
MSTLRRRVLARSQARREAPTTSFHGNAARLGVERADGVGGGAGPRATPAAGRATRAEDAAP